MIDVMVGLFVFGLGAAAFYSLMPLFRSGQLISRYDSTATQLANRMIEQLQTLRPQLITASSLTDLNLIDAGQVKLPYSFAHVPMDEASKYSPAQLLPKATATMNVTSIDAGSVRVDILMTWESVSGHKNQLTTGTIVGGYR